MTMTITPSDLLTRADREEAVYGQKELPAMLRAGAEAMRRVEEFEQERSFVVGALHGWDEAMALGEGHEAAKSAMVRFWKRMAETHLTSLQRLEVKLAALQGDPK